MPLIDIIAQLLIFGSSFVLLYVLFSNKMSKFRDAFISKPKDEPLKFPILTNDAEKLKATIEFIASLSMAEKQHIIQCLFGRSVRFVMGQDTNEQWFESVSYFCPEDAADFNWHYNKLKKESRSEVG